jgi:putative FmdB family regulatory protein
MYDHTPLGLPWSSECAIIPPLSYPFIREEEKPGMPIYTYRCGNCGLQFEQQQSFTDDTLTRCPECRRKTLKKVFQPVGIVFKGSGFYATDHHSPSGASALKDERKDDKKEEKKEEKKEDKGAPEKKESTVSESTPKD